jgi:stathmin
MFVCIIQEEQVQKVRTSNALKFQQLEAAVQEKLEQAQTRRSQLEQEQKEKLRNYVSNVDRQNIDVVFVRARQACRFLFIFFPSINTPQNSRPLEVKQSAVSTLEVRKTEVTAQLETKLTIAEQKREQEIQRKLETAKKHVIMFAFFCRRWHSTRRRKRAFDESVKWYRRRVVFLF